MKTLTEALQEFRKRYPNVTSADIQTFILGWTAHEVAVEVEKLTSKN